VPATKPKRKDRKDDEYRWRASTHSRARQWRKWENVGLKPTLDLHDLDLRWVDPRIPGLDILGAASEITLERTIDGPSTLTIQVRDPWQTLFARGRTGLTATKRLTPAQRRALKKAKQQPVDVDEGWDPISPPYLRGRSARVKLDGASFRLVKVAYSHMDENATLTFEDEIVYLLKRKYGARRVSRKKVTRAQFVLSQLREVKALKPPFICPELMVKQPIDKPDATSSTSGGTSSGGSGGDGGFSPNADLKGMDHLGNSFPITGDKRRNAATVLDEADEHTDKHKPRLALVEACNIEHQWSNAASGDRDSVGILQARRSMHGAKSTDIRWCVGRFLNGPSWTGADGGKGAIALAKAHPSWSAGRIAQTIQGSAFADRYDKTKDASEALLRHWAGAGGSDEGRGSRGGGSYTKSYQYSRKKGESAYGSITRLAEEVGWRFFPMGESVYFMSEEQLYNRRIRYTFRPRDNAVLDLSYDIDWGKPVSECTLQVALDRWGAPPGAVVQLEGWDVPDGRWLITSVRRDWFKPIAEVTLRQPGKAKLEPASEKVTRASTSSSNTTDPDSNSKSGKLFQIVKQFSGTYKYGGGHGPAISSLKYSDALDCSASASLALYKAGLWDSLTTTRSSTQFPNWGVSGPGERVTVYWNASHAFIQFSGDYKGRFDTGGPGGGAGPRYRAQERSTAGFEARHWPGT
jgi:hypothetical protein